MKYHTLPFPRERDQVITEIILDGALSTAEVKSLNRCRGMLQCIFLSDLVTADGRYLESFVFDPGPFKRRSNYCFPRECPTKGDWDMWVDFWHNYVTTGGKLKDCYYSTTLYGCSFWFTLEVIGLDDEKSRNEFPSYRWSRCIKSSWGTRLGILIPWTHYQVSGPKALTHLFPCLFCFTR